jgi:hypothetical protein
MDEQARIDYSSFLQSLAISPNIIEIALLEVEARGLARDEARGFASGFARGQALEREKAQKKKETMILAAYAMGVDISIIARFSDLSEKEVSDLVKKQ